MLRIFLLIWLRLGYQEKLDVGFPSGSNILTRGGESQAADGGLVIRGGHFNTSPASAVAGGGGVVSAMGSNSIYNITNSSNTSSSVPDQTSMLNFVDSNGPFPTRNVQGQYLNNNNYTLPHEIRRVAGGPPSNEVRSYYLELARRLGLALPGFTNNIGNAPTAAEQNPPPGRGGPGGGAGPSGQASFQATRDPRG